MRVRLGQVLRWLVAGWRRADRRAEAGETGGYTEYRLRPTRAGPVSVRLVVRIEYEHL